MATPTPPPIAPAIRPTHVLNVAIGERFRFTPDGPTFVRVQGPDERVWVVDEGRTLPPHEQDYHGCYVHTFEDTEGDQQ